MSPVVAALTTILDLEHAEAVVAHRRTTIKKPLTEFAAKLLAKKFAACPDPNAAAEMMIEKCWQGFEPAWIAAPRPSAHYRPNLREANATMTLMLLEGESDHGRDIDLLDYRH